MATTGIASAFTAGIAEHFYLELAEYEMGWRDFYHYNDMDTPFVDLQGMQGYGQPTQRIPGEAITFDAIYDSFPVRIVPDMWSMGDSWPVEDMTDDIYGLYTSGISATGGGFARAFRTHLELQLSGILINFGYVSGSVLYGPDRVCLMSTQHPLSRNNSNQYFANRPAVDMNFGIGAYNFARTNLLTQPAPDGYQIMANKAKRLCINPTNHVIANQVAKAMWQPNTADRNDNVFRHDNLEVREWVYWRKSGTIGSTFNPQAFNGWFIQGEMHGLEFYMREAFTLESDSDFDTRSMLHAAHIRWGANWRDARGFVGSTGS